MDAAPIPTLETLLSHREFVRGAARAVLGGDDQIEDVVQETWIRALRQGPREAGALRTWLGRVARNLAIDVRRGAARRKRRETAAAQAEALPSVADIAEKEEARRRLVAALLRLDEPSRSALLLRTYEACPVAEVARRLGVPLETARTRLRRGLARLRETLDRESGGDRRAWAVGLLPWAVPPSPPAPVGTAVGGLAGKALVAGAALVLLGLGGGAYLWATRADGPGDGTARDSESAARPEAPSGGRSAIGDPTHGLARAPGRPAPPAAGNPEMPFAQGVVVDTAGHLLPDVAVLPRGMFEPSPGRKQEMSFEFADVLAEPPARTDAQGRFRVEKALPEQVSIVFVKDGFAYAEVRGLSPDATKNQDLRVTLGKGRRASWTVRDTSGRPIARAQFGVFVAPDAYGNRVFGSHYADAEGRCVLDWLPDVDRPVEHLFLSRAAYESVSRPRDAIDLEATFVLRRQMPLVVAVDSDTGRAISGAAGILRLASDGRLLAALTSNASERASFAEAPGILVPHPWPPQAGSLEHSTGAFRALVWAPGHVTTEVPFEVARDVEPPRVEVRLPLGDAGPSIVGRVEPAGVRTLHLCLPPPPGWGEEDVRESRRLMDVPVGEGGRFSIRGLPKGRYRLLVDEAGYAPSLTEVDAPASDVSIALEKAARLRVRVSREDGKPTAGTLVSVGIEGRRMRSTVPVGDDGIARFDGLPAGRAHVALWLELGRQDWSRLPPHPIVPLAAGGTQDAELRLPSPLSVTLRLRDEHGRGVEGIAVRVSARGGWSGQIAGDMDRLLSLQARTDPAGEVTLSLYEGDYQVVGFAGTLRRASEVRVTAGTATIDVPWIPSEAAIFGRVLEVGSGAPIANRPVHVFSRTRNDADEPWITLTDADGRYELPRLPSRPLTVRFRLGAVGLDLDRDPESPWPDVAWEITLTPGTRTEHDVSVPRVRGDGAEEAIVPLVATIVESGTRVPLAGATVYVEIGRGDLWIEGGSFASDEGGRATGRVLLGERYRFHVWRAPAGARVSHGRMTLEASPVHGHLDLEVALDPPAGDGR